MKCWVFKSQAIFLLMVCSLSALSQELIVDEKPVQPGEWGYRPFDHSTIQVTPPGFCWRPQRYADHYQIQCSRNRDFSTVEYKADEIEYNVHTPPTPFQAGKWYWRFRFTHRNGVVSRWSSIREFTIAPDARSLPLPNKEELIQRIPRTHPRLFVRPEQMDELKRRAQTDMNDRYEELVRSCEKILQNPPPTKEPPKYPEDMERKSEDWRKMWWGNRVYTIRALNSAATLAFTRLLGGQEEYGLLAKKILLECAKWDPKGSTGYRYNDEAGMPYNYYFSRTYSFVNDLLSEEEKQECRRVMKIRGEEMYDHLYPRHLWRPYASHSNRAWHFLGEIGIAFTHEIPAAEDWVWFAANVFTNVYPVWCDDDGGWHEGVSYWRSYITRFTWWADIMRVALNINAFDKPYFSQIGYYPMYLQPPGTRGGGFGDLCAQRTSRDSVGLISIVAAQAQNPYWQWYVDVQGGAPKEGGYIGFIRGALPKVESKAPTDLPTSRCFWGTGQAYLNTTIENAQNNVEVIFKSSPFGTQSHGYESNNSFLIYAFGERLFIRTGRRDIYGSKHHKGWMWHSKSTNCITVNGQSQQGHSQSAQGKIVHFETHPSFDYLVGEAQKAYGKLLNRFTRKIVFVKPDVIVMVDELAAPEPSTFEWWLHAPTEMKINDQHDIRAKNGKAAAKVNFLWPANLEITQTDQFDPPPRPRIQLTEYHLTATPSTQSKEQTFVTVIRPYRSQDALRGQAKMKRNEDTIHVTVPHREGTTNISFSADGKVSVQ